MRILLCAWLAVFFSTPVIAHESDLEARIAALEARLMELEKEKQRVEESLETERLSAKDPDWVTRLKALEFESTGFRASARTIAKLEDIEASVSFLNVTQQVDIGESDESYNNYRFDASLAVPAGDWGRANSSLFFHVRAGQSPEQSELPDGFVGLNGTAFQLGGTTMPDDSNLTLIEAWYQLDMPLDTPKDRTDNKHWLSWNIGKIDPFVFFDQNNVANDEATQFLSSAFIHNGILDNSLAAQVGADAYGVTPGMRLAYRYEPNGQESFVLSAAIFGAGEDASYTDAFSNNFSIIQAQYTTQFWGREGNYRVFHWKNDAGLTFDEEEFNHSGWGVSIDQVVNQTLTLFMRYGTASGEKVPFDQHISFGMQWSGDSWSRGNDNIGVGWSQTSISDDYKGFFQQYGYGSEKAAEIYYSYYINEQFQLTSHLQAVQNYGAVKDIDDLLAFSLRLNWMY